MRALVCAGLAMGALLAAAGTWAATSSTAVGVRLDEFTVAAYRKHVPAGTVRFNVTNAGEDPHDLAVRDGRRRIVARLRELAPGERATLRVRLRRTGVYRLLCTIADHEERGMLTRVRIVAPRKR